MQKETIDILTGEIKAHYKPGPGRNKYRYVKGEDVISRLNAAFKHEWSSKVEQVLEKGNQIIVLVSIEAVGAIHQGFGGADIAVFREGLRKGEPVDMSNTYKSAFTNALKKAAEQFGVGLLSQDEYVPPEIFEHTSSPTHNAPPAPSLVSTDPVSDAVVVRTTKTSAQSGLAALMENMNIDELQKQLEQLMKVPSSPSVPVVKREMKVPSSPFVPVVKRDSLARSFVKNEGYSPEEVRRPEVPNPFNQSGDGDEKINDIQLNALSGLTRMKKITCEQGIKLGLGESSSKNVYNQLTRNEAKDVIRALNKLDG